MRDRNEREVEHNVIGNVTQNNRESRNEQGIVSDAEMNRSEPQNGLHDSSDQQLVGQLLMVIILLFYEDYDSFLILFLE